MKASQMRMIPSPVLDHDTAPALLVIGRDVADADILLRDLPENVHVLRDAGTGMLLRVRAALTKLWAQHGGSVALHLVGHGAPGEITVDDLRLTEQTSDEFRKALKGLPVAYLALHGCHTGADDAGDALVSVLENALDTPVHASRDYLGRTPEGATRWHLEGLTLAQLPFATASVAAYPHHLAPSPISGTTGNDTITGSTGADTIDGLAGNDTISALDGNDLLYGNAGDDSIFGGGGEDTLSGGDDNDTLSGGTGNDLLFGDAGNDMLSGNDDQDTLYGGDGNDTLVGASGNDLIYGDDGVDWLQGGKGNDLLYAGNGDDTLSGGAHNDTLYGGAGSDTLSGHSDNDLLFGGDGDDVIRGGNQEDTLFGGAGNDTFSGSVSQLNGDTISDLEAGDVIEVTSTDLTSLDGTTLGSTIALGSGRILNIAGISGNYTLNADLVGSNTRLSISAVNSGGGSSGSGSSSDLDVSNQSDGDTAGTETSRTLTNNTGSTASGALVENTGNGNFVRVTLPSGTSLTESGTSSAVNSGSAGTTLSGEIQTTEPETSDQSFLDGHGQTFLNSLGGATDVDIRSVSFSSTDSTAQTVQITGQSSSGSEAFVIDTTGLPDGSTLQLDNVEFAAIVGSASVTGGAGQNYVVGDAANQFISLGDEDDTLAGGGGADTVGSGWGDDIVYGNQGGDTVFGGGGLDTLYGGQDSDSVFGGNDNDVLYGNKGDDNLTGGQHDDLLYGGQDSDIVYGNKGEDTLHGNNGKDVLFGGQGNDALYGDAGNDYLVGNHGDDTLSGGDGADTFVFSFNGGNETVTDFTAGTDSLALEAGLGVSGGVESGGNTVVTLSDGGTVTFIGVTKETVAEATGWVL